MRNRAGRLICAPALGMLTRRYVKIAAQNPPAADLQRLKLIQGSVGLAKRGHDGLQLVC